ncbi:MAG: nucleoside transporter C-terminal domain-containing protein, partial [Planctomycetota bacterium]
AFSRLLGFGRDGAQFVFGNLAEAGPGYEWGFIFFVQVTSVIVFFASLMGVLYHLGLIQKLIAALAFMLRKTLGVTGAEALAAAANVFVGQTESPLIIRPLLPKLTRSQLMLVMTSGFATIAGSVFGLYVTTLGKGDTDLETEIAKHLLTASLISAPGAFVMAKILIPETEDPPEEAETTIDESDHASGVVDAAARGASVGMRLAMNVIAMLIAFVALIALINWPLGAIGDAFDTELSLQVILGYLFAPVAWGMGIESGDVLEIGRTLGISVVATEVLGYQELAALASPADGSDPLVSARSRIVATYALCGFANFPSVAIQIGGLSTLAPDRRGEIASIGLKAMLAG